MRIDAFIARDRPIYLYLDYHRIIVYHSLDVGESLKQEKSKE